MLIRRFALWFSLMLASPLLAAEPAKSDPAVQPEAEVLARLVEIPGQFPANDLYNYVYIFKFRVVKTVSGKVPDEILVGEYNPRLARTAVRDRMDALVDGDVTTFEAGKVYRLKLVPIAKVWKDAVEDEYFDSQEPRWYALGTFAQ